jgi:putative membrane protein
VLAGASFEALWHPELLGAAALVAAAYLEVVGPLRHRFPEARPVPVGTQASFLAAVAVLYLAQGSPLELLANQYLFSAHMLQAVLLTFVAPPLLLGGLPDWLLAPVARVPGIRRLLRRLTEPVRALVLFFFFMSLFLIPALNQEALGNAWLYLLEHALAFLASLVFWWRVVVRVPDIPPLDGPGLLAYTFAVEVVMTLPFALITFASSPVYTVYAHAPRLLPIPPLMDQQAGGIILRLGSMLSVGVVFARAFFRWARGGHAMDPSLALELQAADRSLRRWVDRP